MIGGLLEHVLLRLNPVDVLVVVYRRFLNDFHGVAFARAFILNKKYFSVGAATNHAYQIEIVEAHLAAAIRARLVQIGHGTDIVYLITIITIVGVR